MTSSMVDMFATAAVALSDRITPGKVALRQRFVYDDDRGAFFDLGARANPGESLFIPAAGDSFRVRQLDRGRAALVVMVPIVVAALVAAVVQSLLNDVATAGTGL